ncbi:MAG TPA: lysylphosphatidylglycerol synthase domain-containing protein [Stellaceae bacterium]
MRAVSILAAILGLAGIAALVAVFGAAAVMRSLLAVGWQGFAAICLIHLGLIAVMGIAWWGLVPGAPRWVFLWARLLREAGSEILPLSPVGGCVIGARALSLVGIPGSIAAASTIVDLTLEFLAKLAYTALALVLLVSLRPGSEMALPLSLGLAAASLAAAGFVAAQQRGFGPLDRLARRLGRGWAERTSAGAAALHAALRQIYALKARLWAGLLLHVACWIAGGLEAWLALRLAGAPLPFKTVLVIEGLLYAIRTFAFAIPNAVGVQEGAYVLIGASFGLTPGMALALSLLKRARDLTIGLPALGAWQIIEGRRLWHRSERSSIKAAGSGGVLNRRES